MNKNLRKVLIAIFWIAVWFGLAIIIANPIILSGPIDVFNSLKENISDADFWLTIVFCLLRISLAFVIGCTIGTILAIVSYKFKLINDFVRPLIELLKSAPIVCFIVLLLVWVGTQFIDVATVILATVPIFFFAIYQACENRNKNILNMLKVHNVPSLVKWRVFEWPSSQPYFKQAAQSGIGIAWKSGVTAQMIGVVGLTIGDKIFTSKLYLDSAQVLLWMFIVILLSWLCEKLILLIIKISSKYNGKKSSKLIAKTQDSEKWKLANDSNIVVANIYKSFNKKNILEDYTVKLDASNRYGINWATGKGKTTLLYIIMGLITQDKGEIFIKEYKPRTFSVCFQQNTLLDNLSVDQNIQLVAGPDSKATMLDGNLNVDELSGGMKRLAQIERALLSESQIVILDEPFTGLDDSTKQTAIKYINDNLACRTLIVTSHDVKDLELLNCKML